MIGNNINTRGMHGRLMFDTRGRAQRVAQKLDLNGTHQHQKNGTTIYMPGTDHRKLNDALRDRGMRPTPVPGDDGGMMGGGMGGMGSPMDRGMDSTGVGSTDAMSMKMDAIPSADDGGMAPTDDSDLTPMFTDPDDEMSFPDPTAPASRTEVEDDVAKGEMMEMRSDVLPDQTDPATDTALFGGGVGDRSEGKSRNVLVGDPDDDEEMELY